jgi:hypothetical protein
MCDRDMTVADTKKRMDLNQDLLEALVDKRRVETHTFHLLCEEMVLTLQNVSYLLGLPIVEKVGGGNGAIDVT